MLAAIGVILQMLEIPLPFIPSFIKLDFSDLPGFIGAFVCGPLAGVLITLIRNVIHIFMGSSAGIGELSNFILSASFVLTAGLIYKKMPMSQAQEAFQMFKTPGLVKGKLMLVNED